METLRFEFRPYARPFKTALKTHHGEWSKREGIILRVEDESGQVGFGEIAPLLWFGSESLEDAIAFCRQLPPTINLEKVLAVPDDLPACQFGFESALERLNQKKINQTKISFSALLPAGEAAIPASSLLTNQGYLTFKWKMGVHPIAHEINVLEELIDMLPSGSKLRLDSNGGLRFEEAKTWLKFTDEINSQSINSHSCQIEFLEQPLPPAQFDQMLELANRYFTPIALDESVATLNQLKSCYQAGWREIFVLKPAIAGFPSRLKKFCQCNPVDVVLSSVFETTIGQQAAMALADELMTQERAIGFGLDHWFSESDPLRNLSGEELWKHL